jgi:diaminopimelate epimerase
MFNRQGDRGKMFGNGVICVVKYIYENEIIPAHRRRARIDTDAGLRDATFEVEDGKVVRVTVDMGCAVNKGTSLAVVVSTGEKIEYEKVDIGSQHAVVFLDEDQDLPLELAAETIENSTTFLGGVAVETVRVINPNEISMLAWETGDGETPACATGAAASVSVGLAKGLLELPVTVHLAGGDLNINIDPETGHCFITGTAVTEMTGEIDV